MINVEESILNAEKGDESETSAFVLAPSVHWLTLLATQEKTRKWWNLILKVKGVLRRTIDNY